MYKYVSVVQKCKKCKSYFSKTPFLLNFSVFL